MPCTHPLVLAIALNAGGLLAAPATAQMSRTVTRSISLAQDGQVDLDMFTGSIDVTAWNQGRVKAKARVEGDDAELVDKTRLRFEKGSGRLSIEVDDEEVEDS